MIAAWMVWSAGAGLLFVAAALAAERVLNRGRRWAWAVAGFGTAALPALRFAGSEGAEGGSGWVGTPIPLEPLIVQAGGDAALLSADGVAALAWLVLSSCMAAVGVGAVLRLLARRRSWRNGVLRGRSVLWSNDTGPAVTGLFRPRIVLPEWVREMAPARQELVLAHEEEHVRAGDLHLRFAAALLLVAFPWNPAFWVQYRRLNAAIEIDCDQRVMNRLPGRGRLYGDLLLRAASAPRGVPWMATALAERPSFLERRIRALFDAAPQATTAKAGLLLFAAVFLAALAFVAPGIVRQAPVAPALVEPSVHSETAPAPTEASDETVAAQPTFTAFTEAPRFANPDEIKKALETEYPPLLRGAGVGGTARVRVFVDTNGTVANAKLHEGSGHEALDQAALRVAKAFRFTPARNRDEVVAVWITLPVTFAAR